MWICTGKWCRAEQAAEIETAIQQEDLKELQEREARKVFSAFRLWENGKSRCLATEYPKDFLETARLLRRHLRENAAGRMILPEKSTADTIFLWAGLKD